MAKAKTGAVTADTVTADVDMDTAIDATVEAVKAAETAAEDEREEIFVPKSSGEVNLLVSINGKNYLLPRGKTSKVPPEVAYEIRRAQRAVTIQDESKDQMSHI